MHKIQVIPAVRLINITPEAEIAMIHPTSLGVFAIWENEIVQDYFL